jgi:hypothetical protein
MRIVNTFSLRETADNLASLKAANVSVSILLNSKYLSTTYYFVVITRDVALYTVLNMDPKFPIVCLTLLRLV